MWFWFLRTLQWPAFHHSSTESNGVKAQEEMRWLMIFDDRLLFYLNGEKAVFCNCANQHSIALCFFSLFFFTFTDPLKVPLIKQLSILQLTSSKQQLHWMREHLTFFYFWTCGTKMNCVFKHSPVSFPNSFLLPPTYSSIQLRVRMFFDCLIVIKPSLMTTLCVPKKNYVKHLFELTWEAHLICLL